MQPVLTTGFNLLPVASKAVPSVIASYVCWSLQCLVSALTQRGRWWTLFFVFQAHLFSHAVGREGHSKQITLACARNASATLRLPPLTACVASLPTLLRLQVAARGTICGRPWAACTSQVQATQVQALGQSSEVQTRLGLHFVPFLGPSSSGDEVFGERDCCNLLPPRRSVIQMYNQCTFSGGC